jgi:hypothetical protein
MILVLSRGGYCPKDRRQAEGLVQLHREMEVGYSLLVTISTDNMLLTNEYRDGVGKWSSLICVLACSKIFFMSLGTRLGIATTRCTPKNRQAYQNPQISVCSEWAVRSPCHLDPTDGCAWLQIQIQNAALSRHGQKVRQGTGGCRREPEGIRRSLIMRGRSSAG